MPPKSRLQANKKLKYSCTACEVGITTSFNAKLHPLLGCLICRKCYDIYGKGDFSKAWEDGVDSDGDDNYCRWCCDGGELFGCTNNKGDTERCHHAYCKDCISRNIPDDKILILDKLSAEEKEKMRWSCPSCDLSKTSKLRSAAEAAIRKLSQKDFPSKAIKKFREAPKETVKEAPKESIQEISGEIIKGILKETSKEVPREIIKEVPKEVIKEVPREVTKEVPKEVIKEVPRESVKEAPKEPIKEVPKETIKEAPRELNKEASRETIKEVPKETIKEVPKEKRMKFTGSSSQRLENYQKLNKSFVNELSSGFSTLIEMLMSETRPNHNIVKSQIDNLQKPLDEYYLMLRDLRAQATRICQHSDGNTPNKKL